MFVNEYKMDIRRYQRWTSPIFYKVKSFPIWVLVFILGVVGTYVFYTTDETFKYNWKSLALMLILISVYRGVAFRWMLAGKQFKLMRAQNGVKSWQCKVIVGNTVRLLINDKPNNEVFFKQIEKCVEAKSYFDLKVENDFVRLDKNGFTTGDAESFKQFMLTEHPEIPFERELKEFDK